MKYPIVALTLMISILASGVCSAHTLGVKPTPRYQFETDTYPLANHEVVATVLSVQEGEANVQIKKPLITILNASGAYTAEKRAEIIRKRAEDATAQDPDWFKQLKCTKVGGDWVITSPVFAGKAEPLVTLDKQFLANLKGERQQRTNYDVAASVREGIKSALDPIYADVHGVGRDLLDAHFLNAVTHATNADYFFHEYGTLHLPNRLDLAMEQYSEAIKDNPHYVAAMRQLCALYKLKGKTQEAADLQARMDALEPALLELEAGNNVLPEKVDGVSTNDKNLDDIPKLNTAIAHYKNAIDKFGGCISFYVILSDCYQTLADIERNNGNADEAKKYSSLETQTLKAIPNAVTRSASTPFKQYVQNRLDSLNP